VSEEAGADSAARPSEPSKRELVVALLLCLAGAALAVYAAGRTWAVDVTPRPAPLPAVRTERTGGDLVPWVSALAVVGLAGAGAVLATRGRTRRLVGALLVLVGLGVAAGGAYGLVVQSGPVGPTAPLLCLFGGLVAATGGALTVVRGQRWPGLGARYESPLRAGTPAAGPDSGGPERVEGRSTSAAWDALDRGEDPTVR
jgi:disulfide bond formation protein DsbB